MMNVKKVGTSMQSFILAVMQDEIVTFVIKKHRPNRKTCWPIRIAKGTVQKFWTLSGHFFGKSK